MPRYENIPSVFIELLDGNLQMDRQITGPVTLVIGTALSGPSNVQHLVTDANKSSAIYGAGSPLLKGLSKAKMGGAQNIILYRVGGKSAQLLNIFGEDSLIETVEETASAGSNYYLYVGTEPNNPLKDCVIVFDANKKIVYSTVTGKEIDLGKVKVFGFNKDAGYHFRIGTPTDPVKFNEVLVAGNIREDHVVEYTATVAQDLFPLFGTGAIISSVVIDADPALDPDTDYEVVGTDLDLAAAISGTLVGGEVVTVTYSLPSTIPDLNRLDSFVAPAINHPTYTLSAPQADVNTVISAVIDDAVFIAGVSESLGVVTLSGLALAAVANGSEIEIRYTVTSTEPAAEYRSGANNINADLKTKYELLEFAYADLETTIATEVAIAIDGVILDAENIADGSTAADKLEYFRKTESDGEITYEWLDAKILYDDGLTGTTDIDDPNIELDDAGQPIILKLFGEVNFAHQLGTWLYNITENERFVLGAIGTSLPATTATSSVAKWIGTLPQTDILGNIISNGSGLLGNKFMAGSTTRLNGFYLTDSGYVDGAVLTDSNGAPIDLGKYLSVVAGAIVTPELRSVGSTLGIENGAAMYAGLVSTIIAGNSTTNSDMPNVGLPFSVKKTKLNELAGVGYVVFYSKPTGVVGVVSGELPTGPRSDYDYISTSIIVANIVTRIRNRVNPFLGKGLNSAMIAAMETAVEQIFKDEVAFGSVIKYAFNVIVEPTSDGRGKIRIPTQIVPAFELREVNIPIKLAYDI